jgi:hypothetical protein
MEIYFHRKPFIEKGLPIAANIVSLVMKEVKRGPHGGPRFGAKEAPDKTDENQPR